MSIQRAAAPDRTEPFFAPWLGWVALGEFVGFLIPMGAESLVIAADLPDLPGAGLLVVAGLGEGAVLGTAMAWRFSRRIPSLNRRRFIVFTAVAAAIAWAVGMLPVVTAAVWIDWSMPLTVAVGLVLGLVLLASIGVGQWLELRRHVPHAWIWVLATAAAWCVGLGAFFMIAPPLWNEGQPLILVLVIGALGAAAMAVAMAAVTGWAAVRLVRRVLPASMAPLG
ncbi:hypothetical protein RBS60_17585 [Sinomonas sp. ASV486]|uniref:hypothetical protein n=1 Tax=Sinomonas sp. ASV486 TaxID=3051170 RepID=UPI0027DAEAF0|nr:hypothetical protein [Sinomonas sp. ASV486]MDQ4492016.1 hypothetical protein [Sinomonas sp. ASV486]